jgi:hypothetical protein
LNGIIGILLAGSNGVARKAFDLKVTNSFALIALSTNSYLLRPPSTLTPLFRYQHLTIPPDLHVHATAADGKAPRLTISNPIVRPDGSVPSGCHRVVTYVTAPADEYAPLRGPRKGAALLSPLPDASYTPASTRLVVDMFVHQTPEESGLVSSQAHVLQYTRPAADRTGSCFRPYLFREVSRRGTIEPRFWFTLRMGYLDSPLADGSPMVVPASSPVPGSPVKATVAMLANAAEIRDSLLYVLGGAPEWWSVTSLPATISPVLVLVLESDDGDRTIKIEVSDSEGNIVLAASPTIPIARQGQPPSGAPKLVPLTISLVMEVITAGRHAVNVFDEEGSLLTAVDFAVRV